MAQLKHDIVQKARANGGNTVIFVSSASQLAGYLHSEHRERLRLWQFGLGFRILNGRSDYQTQLNVRRHSIPRLIKRYRRRGQARE
jgi:hypothetical protein